MEQVKVSKETKKVKEIEMMKETVMNCFVDCRFSIEEGYLPETNKLSEIFNQWDKDLALGDFYNTELYVGVDTVAGLPRLHVSNNPMEFSKFLTIEDIGLGTNARFFFEPNNKVWYESEQAYAECKNDLYLVEFVVCKLFTEIHFQCAIYKEL